MVERYTKDRPGNAERMKDGKSARANATGNLQRSIAARHCQNSSYEKFGEAKRFQIAIDLHCPSLCDKRIFIFGCQYPRIERNIERFGKLLEKTGPSWLNFKESRDLEKFGKGYNDPYPDGIPCARYLAGCSYDRISFSNEISYHSANGFSLTAERLHEYGQGKADALMMQELS